MKQVNRRSTDVIVGAMLFLAASNLFAVETKELQKNHRLNSQAVVVKLFNAFNEHNVNAIALNVSENFEWFNISNNNVSLELSSRAKFSESMRNYFKNIPSARSELKKIHSLGSFVQTIEQAFWTRDGFEKSQCSAATYLIENDKVKTVWYFPSFEC